MVQTIIDLDERQDRVLNVVKGKQGYKNKNDAIRFIVDQYEEHLLEPELRPEFIAKMEQRSKEPAEPIEDFKRHFGLA